jgi:MFS family permease
MGLVMGFSSLVGILIDLFLPQIIKGITVKKLLSVGILAGISFSLILLHSTLRPYVFIFLSAMAVWGVYYEFFGFAEQQFVADSTPLKLHSAVWAILSTFKSLAYFIGPLIASYFLLAGTRAPVYVALFISSLGFFVLYFFNKTHERKMEIDTTQVSFRKELMHWFTLFEYVWPMILLSLYIGIIDATFWTTGTVLTQDLAKISFWGSLFLPSYMLPTLFVGYLLVKKKIFQGKKFLSELTFLISSLILITLGFVNSIALMIVIVFVSSMFLAASYPLVDGVYSDIVGRMGKQRRHLIGLSRSSLSLAYIVGPVLAGAITNYVGQVNTFVIVGFGGVVVATILLLTTPKKLKLPQKEIHEWS